MAVVGVVAAAVVSLLAVARFPGSIDWHRPAAWLNLALLVVMAVSTTGLLWVTSVWATALLLLGLGLGWNFSFVAATAQLADRTIPAEDLEVAVLDRGRAGRAFRRLEDPEVVSLLS